MSDSPEDFFDELTKEINLSPPPSDDTGKTEDTGKTADPINLADAKTVVSPAAGSPSVKDIQVKIPPKMPEFTEAAKGPQGRIIQESSTPTKMAASPPPLPVIPGAKATVASEHVPDIDIDMSDEPAESVSTDYGSRPTESKFKNLAPKAEVQDLIEDNLQPLIMGLIVLILVLGGFYIFKHSGSLSKESSSSVARSEGQDYNWQMNLSRSWLNFGPAPKTWKDFQKSIDQAMVDLGPAEH